MFCFFLLRHNATDIAECVCVCVCVYDVQIQTYLQFSTQL